MSSQKLFDDAPRLSTPSLSPATETCLAHRPWLLALILAVATFAAYQPTWRAGFIWDDSDHLTANPAMTAPHGLKMIWSSLAISRYYPLTLTTFWVQRRLWGLNPLPYHLVNVLLHTANGVLLFLVLRRLKIPGAWAAAMLWTLHPVNVESVAWITELKNTQSGLFFFLSILCFLRFDADKKTAWYTLAVACGLAAMLSKPSTVVLPLVLLLCVWWERGRWRRGDLVWIAPFFGLAMAMSAMTVMEQHRWVQRAGVAEWLLAPSERLIVAGKTVWFYAAHVLWPANLMFVYPRWDVSARSVSSWLPVAGVIAVGALLGTHRQQPWARAALFGTGFFVVALLPVLGFFNVYFFRFSFVADHFQYLACIGLISLAVSTGTAICERAGQRGRVVGTLTVAIVALILGARTWRQGHIYQDVETLWRDTLARNPQCWMAHNDLGSILGQSGRVQEAMQHYEQALRIKPDYVEAHYNLGIALAQTGNIEEAIAHYEQALRINPDFAEGHFNLGNALLQEGKVSDAIGHYEQAVRIKPDYAAAHFNLGNALLQEGKVSDAIAHYKQVVRIKPDFSEAHLDLGLALAQTGKTEEAIAQYEQALRLKPDSAEAHIDMGNALLFQGKDSEAMAQYQEALRISPEYPQAHVDLGIVLVQTGRVPEAIKHWEEALRLRPDDATTHYNLGNALQEQGRTPEAIDQYQQALRLRPDFIPAKNALARFGVGR